MKPGLVLDASNARRYAALMKIGIIAWLNRRLANLRELFNRPVDVHYTSVPVWKPWRDF